MFRFLFNFPQWAQIAGLVVGLVVAAAVLRYLWRRREGILSWMRTRSRGIKWALAGSVTAGALVALALGGATWDYMQHNNDFCTGCHIMENPFQAFGTGAGKHQDLKCHDCHQQPLTTSMWQLALWVAERPDKIAAHSPVPNERCNGCHNTGQDSTWQRIATTAGHRVHLESDSADLADLKCVTCHGKEIHHFVPVNETCGQSGCHVSEDTRIVLGKMADQTDQHCVQCHRFTAEVPLLATYDSARGTLVPAETDCVSCHDMQKLLATFNPKLDPHEGTCGMCHKPHEQKQPGDAATTCVSCHEDWQSTPFHVGVNHSSEGKECLTCHPPHAAKVDPSDCVGCHEAVNKTGANRVAPLPFDTAAALQESALPNRASPLPRRHRTAPERDHGKAVVAAVARWSDEWPRRGKGDKLPGPSPPAPVVAPADSFPHQRHDTLACLTCHATRSGHGKLTFEQPRGCQICHHRGPSTNDCSRCHQPEELDPPRVVEISIGVENHEPRNRPVSFEHATHGDERCIDCHRERVSLAPDQASGSCRDCHDDHHAEVTRCAECHRTAGVLEAHTLAQGHGGCVECHAERTIEELRPERTFCLVCHDDEVDHYPKTFCTNCHLQDSPEDYSRFLLRGAG